MTNYSLFGIMVSYSLIQYTTSLICQFYYTYPSDLSFVFWDVACNFCFILTIGVTETEHKLSAKKPESSLSSIYNVLKILFMFLFQLIGQILMIVSIITIFS